MSAEHNPQVTTFGEVLIDRFSVQTEKGTEIQDVFGGAPANTAVGLARLGIPVSFVGKIGSDEAGKFLVNTLKHYGVVTDGVVVSPSEPTTVAFVALTREGERSFTFHEGAHSTITPDEVHLPPDTTIFHFGSLTQIRDKATLTTEKLLAQAKEYGAIVSYDPNIREALWVDLSRARDVILETAQRVDILKVNEEEAKLLSGKPTVEEAVGALFSPNLNLLVVTLAEKGCFYKTKHHEGTIPAIPVVVIDTTGAGDAFNAGVISQLYRQKKRISDITHEELKDILYRAIVIGSLTTTQKGAITAFPSQEQIDRYSER